MEWMDRVRRVGGVLWVGAGVVFGAVAWLAVGAVPGPITSGVCVVVVAVTVASVARARTATTRVLAWVASVALGLDFLGAVADRFGLFGGPGSAGVWWGSWSAFVDDTSRMAHGLTGWPAQLMAAGATVTEVALGLALCVGWQRRWVGKAAAGLLAVYLVLMSASGGVAEVARFALPVLIGGALVVSAVPRSTRPNPDPDGDARPASVVTAG